MRIGFLIGVVLSCLTLASCSSFLADNLPEWAGGLPKGTPPRVGSSGYDAYLRDVSRDHATSTAPPAAQPTPTPSPTPPELRQPVDKPSH